MNAKGWYSTKTLVNTRTSNVSATVVHRPARFVDSQPEDDDSTKGPTTILGPGEEPPFALVPLRKRPFPRSPSEPTSPRKRTHAAQDVCGIDDTKPCVQDFSPSAVVGVDAYNQINHAANRGKAEDEDDSNAFDKSASDDQERESTRSASSFGCDDKLDDSDDGDDDGDDGDGQGNSPDQYHYDNDGNAMDSNAIDNEQLGDNDDHDDCDERHRRHWTTSGGDMGVRHTMHWDDNSDGGSGGDDMPSAADWKRSPAAATAVCLRAEERRLQMLCKVHEAVLRQTEAALDGVRFAIRRLERMHRQDA
nr:hypothetical protein [Pandoravirus aubagnensis]